MNEFTDYKDILYWRFGEPVYTMSCDRTQGHTMLEDKAGNQLQFYSLQKELWSLQLVNGIFIMGVGNPFYVGGYRQELYNDVNRDDATYEWIRSCFNECGINTVEQCVMFELKGTTRLTVAQNGIWHLFLPDGRALSGTGDCSPDSPQMKAVSKKMKHYFYSKFVDYIRGLFDLLKPIEFETVDEE